MPAATIAIATPGLRRQSLWILPPILMLSALFVYPLALIVRQSLTTADGLFEAGTYGRVFGSRMFTAALLHTIEIALGATAGCLAVGFIMALVLTFVPFPGARAFSRLIDTFIALPTFLIALALTFIYGSAGIANAMLLRLTGSAEARFDFLYTIGGVILAEITVYTPFVMRPLLAAFSLIETAQLEVAGSLGAGAWRIIRQVILPQALPALLAGGSLCLLLTVNEFGIVFFIGAKGVITLPLLIYGKAIQEDDYTSACVLAVVNILLSLSLYCLYRVLVARVDRAGQDS
jgi:2-aminoethylphosphonate transport system permease protein